MACPNVSPYQEFPGTSMALLDCTTTPFQLKYPISTPLILPRGWPDDLYQSPGETPSYDTSHDFQSNHLENDRLNLGAAQLLSGLGIRNIELPKDTEPNDYEPYGTHNAQGQAHYIREPRNIPHTFHRTEPIFAFEESKNDRHNFNQIPESNTRLSSPWSFSSILRVAELAVGNIIAPDMQTSISCRKNVDGMMSQLTGDPGDYIDWSFEKLSASTGMSVADFAAQISATAEVTLKRMSGDNLNAEIPADVSGGFQWFDDFGARNHTSIWLPKTPELSLPLGDVNTQNRDTFSNSGCAGVNPADILSVLLSPPLEVGAGPVVLIHPEEIHLSQKDPVPEVAVEDPSTAPTLYQSPAPDLASPYQVSCTLRRLKPAVFPESEDEASIFQSPSSSEYSPNSQSLGMKRGLSSRTITKVTQNTVTVPKKPDATCSETRSKHGLKNSSPNLGTPVFDAHRGIDIEVLKAKAERYRLRNQGRDYDKRWLISFAGKLSLKGELVDEFRCYVTGCKQSNKRRDHILIHVGAHLDQRPFKCMHCSSRFLRKNECKRHELSHTGIRPFSCHLCSSPTTFVRQDLLKRHMNRSHRVDVNIIKENLDARRPKKRPRY